MLDINHNIGGDILASASGGLSPVDGTLKGQQRVLRRLLTNPGDYIWHTNYGGGLGAMVGTNATIEEIDAVIRSQIALESVVSKYPVPTITVTAPSPGTVQCRIQYADASSKTPQILSFNINI